MPFKRCAACGANYSIVDNPADFLRAVYEPISDNAPSAPITDMQDGILKHYLSQSPFADSSIEKQLDVDFDFRLMRKRRKGKK